MCCVSQTAATPLLTICCAALLCETHWLQVFSQLGGLQLDRDIRSLVAAAGELTSKPVRDKFARLTQVGALLLLGRILHGPRNGAAQGTLLGVSAQCTSWHCPWY